MIIFQYTKTDVWNIYFEALLKNTVYTTALVCGVSQHCVETIVACLTGQMYKEYHCFPKLEKNVLRKWI